MEVLPDHCYFTIKILAFSYNVICIVIFFFSKVICIDFSLICLKCLLLERRKCFAFWNLIKKNSGYMFSITFAQNFQKRPPARRTIQKWYAKFNKEEGLCSRKRISRHLQLKEFATCSSEAPKSQSEELFMNFRCPQQPFDQL